MFLCCHINELELLAVKLNCYRSEIDAVDTAVHQLLAVFSGVELAMEELMLSSGLK